MIKTKRLYTSLLLIISVLLTHSLVTHIFQDSCFILKNISKGLPFSYFVGYSSQELERGNYMSFDHPKSETLIIKIVAGLPGDHISFKNDKIYINGYACGEVKKISPSGMSLNPISEGIIPDGYVFMQGLHPDSFDSRYHEFGLVAISQLKARLWPLF